MNVNKSILKGLSEAVEYEKGNKSKAKKSILEITELPKYHGNKIKKIRIKENLSQAAFAKALGVSVKAVEAWEADRNIPSGPVQRLLSMIEQDKEVLEKNKILIRKK